MENIPLGGLEPPHLAPEANALSTELQGQKEIYFTMIHFALIIMGKMNHVMTSGLI